MKFLILSGASIFHLKCDIIFEARVISRAFLPLLSRGALNDGNCRLKMPVVHGRGARDTLPHTFNIGVLKCNKSNSTTIKHISMNLRT